MAKKGDLYDRATFRLQYGDATSPHDFRNARDKVILQGLWVITGLNPFLGPSCRVKKLSSSRRIGPLGSFVPAVFGRDVCLMSGSLSHVS